MSKRTNEGLIPQVSKNLYCLASMTHSVLVFHLLIKMPKHDLFSKLKETMKRQNGVNRERKRESSVCRLRGCWRWRKGFLFCRCHWLAAWEELVYERNKENPSTHTKKMTMVATLINKTICIRGSNKFASLVRLGEGKKKPCTWTLNDCKN